VDVSIKRGFCNGDSFKPLDVKTVVTKVSAANPLDQSWPWVYYCEERVFSSVDPADLAESLISCFCGVHRLFLLNQRVPRPIAVAFLM
jgi:hypothetical protein